MFEFNAAGVYRRDSAGNFRQLVANILLHSSRFQIAIRGLTPCNCGREMLMSSLFEIKKGSSHDFRP